MTDLVYPCGCVYEFFVNDHFSPGNYEFQVEDDGFDNELCDLHRKQLEQEYEQQ